MPKKRKPRAAKEVTVKMTTERKKQIFAIIMQALSEAGMKLIESWDK